MQVFFSSQNKMQLKSTIGLKYIQMCLGVLPHWFLLFSHAWNNFSPPSCIPATLCFWLIHTHSWTLRKPALFNPLWIWSEPHLWCLECFFIYKAISDFYFWLSWHLYEVTCLVIPLCKQGNWEGGYDKLGELPWGREEGAELNKDPDCHPPTPGYYILLLLPGTSVCLFCYSLYEDIEAMKWK